jgi:ATP-binding cassette subfamily B protein/subfamily B ATP-binding cassette protein MsbA
MDRGVVVERGTHDELFAMNGVYRKLCDMQNTSGGAPVMV